MANIFALQGSSNSGKSSTLIHLLNLVVAKYPNATVQTLHGGTKEVQVIVHPVNGKKVGIESRGDPGSHLQQSLTDFRNANCNIVFCACRTRGMTVNWINAMSPPDSVQFVQQTRTQVRQQNANATMASNLMKMAGI